MSLKGPIFSTSLPGITYLIRWVPSLSKRRTTEILSAVPDRRCRHTFSPRGPPVPPRDSPFLNRKLPCHDSLPLEDSPKVQERVFRSQAIVQRHGNVAKPHDDDDGGGRRHGRGLALYDGARHFGTMGAFLIGLATQKNLDPEQLKEVQESQARMVKMQSSITSGDLTG